jgi:hypothetical protein
MHAPKARAILFLIAGRSIPVVRVHGVDVDRVRFPTARQKNEIYTKHGLRPCFVISLLWIRESCSAKCWWVPAPSALQGTEADMRLPKKLNLCESFLGVKKGCPYYSRSTEDAMKYLTRPRKRPDGQFSPTYRQLIHPTLLPHVP